jgi:uncharacterized membrane protein YqjE
MNKMVKYHFKNEEIKKEFRRAVSELSKLFSDHEIRLLLFWIIIGPLCALAYLIWVKYERFRLIALILFAISLIYFIGQLGGLWYVLSRILR